MGMSISEKILARASGKDEVVAGEFVQAKPDMVAVTDTTIFQKGVVEKLKELAVKKIPNPDKVSVTFDHRVPAYDILSAEMHKVIRQFVKEYSIKNIYDVGRHGISHQIMAEKGRALPGTLYVADDTHATTLGAFGAFACMLGIDLLNVFVTGENWFRVPESLKFNITGDFKKGVISRDLIALILSDIGLKPMYKAMEFVGPTIKEMSIDGRMTLCNLVPIAEAKNGIINPDQKTIDYVKSRTNKSFKVLTSDPDAEYEEVFDYDVSTLEPLVAMPGTPNNAKSVVEIEGVDINQAYIGSCASGRMEDLRIAAKILKGRKINPNVRMLIFPSSQEIYRNALREGLIEIFLEAGATICNPTCGPCAGMHMGLLASDEVCIATSTLNIKGRMGSPNSKLYLASAATVTASAVEGKISDPRDFL